MKIIGFNRPTARNLMAEAGFFALTGISICLYYRWFAQSVPFRDYALLWATNALLGGIIEYYTEEFYHYYNPLFRWFGKKDFSATFVIAYGGCFSLLHLASLHLIQTWHIPWYIGWILPNFLLTMVIFGGIDSLYYNVLRYYHFDPAYYNYAENFLKIVKLPVMRKTVPLYNLPFGIVVAGYGVVFGVLMFNLNNLLVWGLGRIV